MNVNWGVLSEIAKDAMKVGGANNKRVTTIISLIEGVQTALKGQPGEDKKAAVERGMAILDKQLALVTTPEQLAAVQAAESELTDAYVASRNAEARLRAACEAVDTAYKAF